MENNSKLYAVPLDEVKIGDVIFLSDKPNATSYTVLDKGTPFILIENNKTHFANLYRPTVIYKFV